MTGEIQRITGSIVAWTDGRFVALGFYAFESGITRSRTSGGAVAHRPGVAMMFDTNRPKLKPAQP